MPSAVMPSGFAALPVRADAPVAAANPAPATASIDQPAAAPSAATAGFAALAPAGELPPATAPSVVAPLSDAAIEPKDQADAGNNIDTSTDTKTDMGTDTGLAAEQWLMHMLDQQLAQVQARDAQPAIAQVIALAGQPGAAPAAVAPLGQTAFAANADATQPTATPITAAASAQPAAIAGAAPSSKPEVALRMDADASRQLSAPNKFSAPVAQAQSADTGATGQTPAAQDKATEPGASQSAPASSPLPLNSLNQQPASPTIATQAVANPLTAPASSSPAVAQPAAGMTLDSTAADASLRLQGPEAKWGEQLLHALRDKVHVQLQQQMQSATIRLDPPELGSLEIFLSHESGRLTVQISAAQADVGRLLQSTSDRLRQDLAGPQFSQVDVYTSSDSQSGQQRSRQPGRLFAGDEPIAAAASSTENSQRGKPTNAGNLLVSV